MVRSGPRLDLAPARLPDQLAQTVETVEAYAAVKVIDGKGVLVLGLLA